MTPPTAIPGLFVDSDVVRAAFTLAVALAIGLVIGLEREWSQSANGAGRSFAGVRTFALTALLGGASAYAPPAIGAVALGAVAALCVYAQFVAARDTGARGVATEIALLLAFALGLLAGLGMLATASSAGVATAVLLSLKSRLGKAATELSERELRSILQFLAVSVIVLPILPDRALDSLAGLNPRAIWILVVLISGVSFVGYWLTRAFGARNGALLTGLVGGLASSTATTASLARLAAQAPAAIGPASAGIIIANMVMLVRLAALAGLLAPAALPALWPSLAAAWLVGGIAAIVCARGGDRDQVAPGGLGISNPFELRPAIIFAGVLAAVSLAAERALAAFGDYGLNVVAAISGVADVDALTLSAAGLMTGGAIAADAAATAIWIAAASNMLAKAAFASVIGGRALAIRAGAPLVIAAAGGVVAAIA